jgi:hypothetical protein
MEGSGQSDRVIRVNSGQSGQSDRGMEETPNGVKKGGGWKMWGGGREHIWLIAEGTKFQDITVLDYCGSLQGGLLHDCAIVGCGLSSAGTQGHA